MTNLQSKRLKNEISQTWTVSVKDVLVCYSTPGMIMFGFLMPFFMFFSYSVGSNQGAGEGLARLLAMTSFFTVGAACPFIIPTERRHLRSLTGRSHIFANIADRQNGYRRHFCYSCFLRCIRRRSIILWRGECPAAAVSCGPYP